MSHGIVTQRCYISLCDIGTKVWISYYPAISVSFRTVHSLDFFDLDCSALFALPCLLNFQSRTALDTLVHKISSHRHLCVLKSQSWKTLFTKFSVSNNPRVTLGNHVCFGGHKTTLGVVLCPRRGWF